MEETEKMIEEMPRESGMPIDLTKEEFIDYHMTVARRFGTLKMQKPSLILFGIYIAVTVAFLVVTYVQSGIIDWLMLLVLGLTLVSTVLLMTVMPHRVKRNAEMLYEAGNINGYYGELVVNRLEIKKIVGEGEDVTVPLNDRAMYIETPTFMAFFTVGGKKAIILPSRCMTPQAAAAVRESVFADGSRVIKRVTGRMNATAAEPIERRDLLAPTETLFSADFRYDEKEIKDQLSDMNWKRYVRSLPTVVLTGALIGGLLAVLQESLPVFFVVTVAVPLGMLLLSGLGTRSTAKRVMLDPSQTRLLFRITKRGIDAKTAASEQSLLIRWECLDYASENAEYVEFYGLRQIVRIPKRAIDDFEAFRTLVDTYYIPKHKRS